MDGWERGEARQHVEDEIRAVLAQWQQILGPDQPAE
jgi:hypothetical protein